jgi:hypothetical protein
LDFKQENGASFATIDDILFAFFFQKKKMDGTAHHPSILTKNKLIK